MASSRKKATLPTGQQYDSLTHVSPCCRMRDARARVTIKLLGTVEISSSRWSNLASHVVAIDNVMADGMSRFRKGEIPLTLAAQTQGERSQEIPLGGGWERWCKSMLDGKRQDASFKICGTWCKTSLLFIFSIEAYRTGARRHKS